MYLIAPLSWMAFLTNFKPLRLSAPAKIDLQKIAEYTEAEWGLVQKNSYLDLIKKSFHLLSSAGNIGKKRDDIALGLYSYCIKQHCVYFRESAREYTIIRILHSRMEAERHLP